jgi:RecG-like helicase
VADASWTLDGRRWKFLESPHKYCKASKLDARPLKLEPTCRQFRTAREILRRLSPNNPSRVEGILLADDVGLGKTTIAALIAWVVAGSGGSVRVFAPNEVMKRRWGEELEAHVSLLNKRAKHLMVDSAQLKVEDRVDRLRKGRIQVGTHYQLVSDHNWGKQRTGCDLMIIDEAHRMALFPRRVPSGFRMVSSNDGDQELPSSPPREHPGSSPECAGRAHHPCRS